MMQISGFLTVNDNASALDITYSGNMGASIKDIDFELANLNYPTIEQLKVQYSNYTEEGSPDYWYHFCGVK